jgi:hypothetical protein
MEKATFSEMSLKINVYETLGEKPEGKRQLRRRRQRLDDNVKMGVKVVKLWRWIHISLRCSHRAFY